LRTGSDETALPKRTSRYRIVTLFLLLACIAFIFSNSLQDAAASSAESGRLLELVNRALGGLGLAMSHNTLRKIAHFAEFALEGVLLALTARGYGPWRRRTPLLIGCGFLTGCVDELLQLTSAGRAARPPVKKHGALFYRI
jgi:VanZ family protein